MEKGGLTEFGVAVINEMRKHQIIVDVAHSSEKVVEDLLVLSGGITPGSLKFPLVISHTGFQGHCESLRNIPDDLIIRIARGGGLIGVGFWDAAICTDAAKDLAASIVYGINLVGAQHIALGSDFDGGVNTSFDSSQMAVVTQALLDANVSEEDIRAVMGGNMLRFLRHNLPPE